MVRLSPQEAWLHGMQVCPGNYRHDRCLTNPISDDECVDSVVSESPEAKKRRYRRDPMSECSDRDFWIT